MKTYSPTEPKKIDPVSILLIGPPGGGKTALMLQFKRLGIIDVDVNLDASIATLRKYDPQLSFKYDNPCFIDGRKVKDTDVWPNILNQTRLMAADKDLSWVGLDGLTHLNFHLINHVRGGATEMSQDKWIPFRQKLIELITTVRLSGKNYIMSCHEEVTMDRDGTIKRRKVSVDSKLSDFFQGWFSNVWRCYALPGPLGKPKFKVVTTPTGTDDLKRSNPSIPAEFEIDLDGKFDFNETVYRHLGVPGEAAS